MLTWSGREAAHTISSATVRVADVSFSACRWFKSLVTYYRKQRGVEDLHTPCQQRPCRLENA